jgi:hypothetical protein
MNMDQQLSTPWMNLVEAAGYAKRGRRFLAREVKAGRRRAARGGGRGEYLTRAVWLDQWLEDLAVPVMVRRSR